MLNLNTRKLEMSSLSTGRYSEVVVDAVGTMADKVNLASAGEPAITAIPAEWTAELDGYLTAVELKALIEKGQQALTAAQQADRGVQKVLLKIIAENTMLRVPVDDASVAKSTTFICSSGLQSLKETAEVYKDELSMIKAEVGSREITAIMKIGKIKKDEKEIKGKKKPRSEVNVSARALKLGLGEDCIPQQDLDKHLVRCEEGGSMFIFCDLLTAPIAPLDRGWLSPEALKKATAAKKVLKAGENGECVFDDVAEDQTNSKGAPLGLYLAGLQRWLTMLSLAQRIRLSTGYCYISIILDLACAHSVSLAQSYDESFRRKLSASPKWALGEIDDPGNRAERDKLFRERDQGILDRIMLQKTLGAAKSSAERGGSSSADRTDKFAPRAKGHKDKGKGKKSRPWIPDHIWWGKGQQQDKGSAGAADPEGGKAEPDLKRQKTESGGAGGKP